MKPVGSAREDEPPTPTGSEVPVRGLVTECETDQPFVSVTFDEHLGENTWRILDAFAEREMHGTFFTLGEEAESSPEVARAILGQGHELGNHAYQHRRLTGIPDHGRRQYGKALRAIETVTGFRTALARPPDGLVDDGVVAAADSLGMTTVKWGRSPLWWVVEPALVAQTALDGIKPGRIVLLHQTDHATEALPSILAGLQDRGLHSVPVTQLLGGRFRY